LLFDITDEAGVLRSAQPVRDLLNGETLFGLVNNAGVAVPAPLMHQPIADFRHQIEVNLVGALIVTQAFIPLLGSDRALRGNPGRIINISSVGGKNGAPFLGAYAASKHALEGLSESLRRELMLYGIDVIIIGPGSVATPIWDKAEALDLSRYEKTDYLEAARRLHKYIIEDGRQGYPPEKVGEVVFHALTTPKPRVRYAVVPGNLVSRIVPALMPKRTLDAIIAKNLGFTQRPKRPPTAG
jgi:NAD(P)-dependent dehydrogenase (short-subunit alcohol dehydrogenase family)